MKSPKLSILLLLLFVCSCKQETSRAFYYWKSVYKISSSQEKTLSDLKVTKLYIRFFDVDWNESAGLVTPKAKIRFLEKPSGNFEIIPVVYIVNRSLQKIKAQQVTAMASHILKLTNEIAENNNLSFSEFQLDCDWTESTRENYFALLETIKNNLASKKIIISATIRLHQVKYQQITGVPPVDRGMLMYYNMGKINTDPANNSIFNQNDAAKYIDYIPGYPLKLDAALPAFSWGIHIRKGNVIELLNNMTTGDFINKGEFIKSENNIYIAQKPFFYRGYYFMEGDEVKIEETSPKECHAAAKQLKSKLNSAGTVAIYHLDSLIFSRYEKQDFEKVFNYYR